MPFAPSPGEGSFGAALAGLALFFADGALQSRSEQYVSEIFEALRDVCVASRANKPIGDKMIMNAAFLVERDRENAFDARVKALGGKYDSLTFRYTGPWPPYNFVNIRLKLERAK